MKLLPFVLLFMCFVPRMLCQTSDCGGAIVLCNDFYSEEDAPLTSGNSIEIPVGSCNPTEVNSIWYTFTVQQDGLLSYIIDPNNDGNDYDWELFDITDNGCAGIPTGESPSVSCNSWGVLGVNGATGISTANGGSGSSNGPGDLNGPPFNADVPVTAGTTFALVILNWSNSLEGYSIDFGESTASLYDDDPPVLVSAVPDCSGSQLIISFSEVIETATVQQLDFSIDGPNGGSSVSSFEAQGGDLSQDDVFILYLDPPLGEAGTYTFYLEPGADYVEDACGNQALGSIDFEVTDPLTFVPLITNACNGEGGIIEVTGIAGGTAPFDILLNGTIQSGLILDELGPGSYDVTVTDDVGCSVTLEAVVDNFDLVVDAGDDQIPCDMFSDLEGQFNGGTFTWSSPPEVVVGSLGDPLSQAVATIPGTYSIEAIASLGSCVVTDYVEVTFSYPLLPEVTIEDVSCHDACDGSVKIVMDGVVLALSLSGTAAVGDSVVFGSLCVGSYDLLAIDFAGCTFNQSIDIWQPPAVVADFDWSPESIEVPETTVSFMNLSTNDTAVFWSFGVPAIAFSTDTMPVIEFPPVGDTYDVILTATDQYGCIDTIMKRMVILDNFQVFAPNTFTPNGDDINEVFLPQFTYLPSEYSLIIFDRWGEPIFETTDPQQAWTGNVRQGGHFASDGVYPWIMEVRGNEVERHTLVGHVVLIR